MRCRVCNSTDLSIRHDIYGLDNYNNIVPGNHVFKVDAGPNMTWDSTGSRYKRASLLECYRGNLHNTQTAIKNQYKVRMIIKQYVHCDKCGFDMHPNTGRAYTVKP